MAERRPGRGADQFIVRFPEGMRDKIKKAADENGRSMNAEIVKRLQDTLEEDELEVTPTKEFTLYQGPVKEILDQLRELKELNLRVVETREVPDGGEDEVTLAYSKKKRARKPAENDPEKLNAGTPQKQTDAPGGKCDK